MTSTDYRMGRFQICMMADADASPADFRDTADCYRSAGTVSAAQGCDVVRDGALLAFVCGSPLEQDGSKITANAAALMLEQYQQGPDALSDRLKGDFSWLLADAERRIVHAGVDRFGRQPLYYAEVGDGLIVASSLGQILAHPVFEPRLRQQGIYDYVYFHMVPSPVSIYHDVFKLPAAHTLTWQQGALKTNLYWQPDFIEHSDSTEQQQAEHLMCLLQEVVGRSADSDDTGAFLSGGLDSSTVSGVLASLRDKPKTFSIGFDAKGYDEMAFARIAAQRFGTDQNEYYVTPADVVEAVPRIAAFYDEPFGNSSALPAYFCARMALQNGCSHLLAGDGGDELFAGNERYQKQGVFELYGSVPTTVRRFLIEPVISSLPAAGLFAKAQSYIHQANLGLPDRLQTYNFLHRHAPEDLFSEDFLTAVDAHQPLELLRSVYHRPEQAQSLNRMLYLDWQFTLADNDLRKVTQMCELAGVRVSFPLLDDELVDFSTAIPSHWKMDRKTLRRFYKKATAGLLPDEIINKSKHGFGLPFGVWMRDHQPLQELGYDTVLALKKRGWFRAEFLEQVVDLHRTGHASYYGELVWILMMLELWLQAHQ